MAKILAISGSLRKASFNTMLMNTCKALLPADMQMDCVTLHDIPFYDGDVHEKGIPEVVTRLGDTLRKADGLLIVSPEYNYSIPGVLKNTIDWLSRLPQQPFDGKKIMIMGASMSVLGTARMQYHLRQTFVYLNGNVMNRPEVMVGACHQKFDANGKLSDEATQTIVTQALAAFAASLK